MTLSFLEDLKIKKLYIIKFLLFCQTAGDMALFPFFTLHIKSLGISLAEIGVQFAISPIASLIAIPLLALVTDKMGNYKIILSSSLIFCALFSIMMLNLPKIKNLPECSLVSQHLSIDCPNHSNPMGNSLVFLNMNLPDCLIRKETISNKVIHKNTKISLSLLMVKLNDCIIKCTPSDNMNNQVCLYNELDGHYCFLLEDQDSLHLKSKNLSTKTYLKEPLTFDISPNAESLIQGNRSLDALLNTITYDNTKYLDITCTGNSSCKVLCPLHQPNIIPHFTQKILQDPYSKRTIFWSYLILRILLIIFVIIEVSLIKSAILTVVEENKTEYGYQRLWSTIAIILIPPIVGLISDEIKKSGNSNTFTSCFYVYSGFKLLMAVSSYFVNLDIKPPTLKIWKRLNELIKSKEVGIFLFFVTILGTIYSFIEIFIVCYFEELNATRILIGLSFSVAAICGIPFSIFAGSIERKIGSVPILILGLITYAIRLIGYSYAKTPSVVLIFESFEGITSALVLITITTYASTLSSFDLLATLQATWAVLHFSVGRAIGSLVGGYLIENFGTKQTFQMLSSFAFASACVYSLLYIFYLRHQEKSRKELQANNKDKSSKQQEGHTINHMLVNERIKEAFISRDIETARKIS